MKDKLIYNKDNSVHCRLNISSGNVYDASDNLIGIEGSHDEVSKTITFKEIKPKVNV